MVRSVRKPLIINLSSVPPLCPIPSPIILNSQTQDASKGMRTRNLSPLLPWRFRTDDLVFCPSELAESRASQGLATQPLRGHALVDGHCKCLNLIVGEGLVGPTDESVDRKVPSVSLHISWRKSFAGACMRDPCGVAKEGNDRSVWLLQ